jgi:hypothetical protein
MATSLEKIDLLLNFIEENCDVGKYCGALALYMIDCLALIENRMPPTAADAFRISRAHAAGQIPLKRVIEAIQLCWEYLEKDHRDMCVNDPEVSATRAVICLLKWQEQPRPDDFLDLTSFFLRLLKHVEDRLEDEEILLKKHFGTCLERSS